MGLGRTTSVTLAGLHGAVVRIEADIVPGLPTFVIGGLPDTACRQSGDRIKAAGGNSGLDIPVRRITVNLSPASLPKVGSHFDLGIAIAVLVATGGGGLVAGIAAALEQQPVRVVAAEPENAATLHRALLAGHPVDVPVSGVAADSLGARRVGDIAFDVARRCSVQSVLVDDESIVRARWMLWDRWRLLVEHGAATALAALLTGAYRPRDGERVAVVLCGANTAGGA